MIHNRISLPPQWQLERVADADVPMNPDASIAADRFDVVPHGLERLANSHLRNVGTMTRLFVRHSESRAGKSVVKALQCGADCRCLPVESAFDVVEYGLKQLACGAVCVAAGGGELESV